MATVSEVKVGLQKIAETISAARSVMEKVKVSSTNASVSLDGIVADADLLDVINTINAYDGSDAFEALTKSELALLTTEFIALKAKADQVAALDLNS